MIDIQERLLMRDGLAVPLTPKAFDVLATLVERAGRLISKDELFKKVWPDAFVEESNLSYNVFALRKALGDTAENGQYIETVPKRGYRFVATVTPMSLEDGALEASGSPAASLSLTRRWALRAPAPVLVVVYFSMQPWHAPPSSEVPAATPLIALAGVVRAPSLSPDGKHVVFTWTGPKNDNPDLYVQQIGAGSPMRLTSDPGNDYSPSWSPDGRVVAFLRRQPVGAGSEVRLIAPLGGDERQIAEIETRLPAYRPLSVSWCPDSACVLVTDAPVSGKADAVFAISLATSEKRQLTYPEGRVLDADPAISPDGRWLVFRRDTTPFSGAFYRVSLKAGVADGEPVRVTSTLGAGRPAWLSNSRDILFSGRGGLWKLDTLAGGPPVRLPYVGQGGHTPIVSHTADGRQRLVYVRSLSDTNVWRVDTTGSGALSAAPPAAALTSTRGDSTPSLSPNGLQLAFTSDRLGDSEVWVAGVDGSNAVKLTSMGIAPGFPRWSPDGRRIAFHGDPEGRPAVLIVAAGGGKTQNLTADAHDGAFPSFSRDGRWIYFCSLRTGEQRIWKMPSSGGAATQVTENTGTIAMESYDGRDLYYVSATDRPSSLWRLPLPGGTPVKLLDGVVLGSFDVVERGVYYLDRVTGETGGFFTDRPGGETRLRYFSFATSQSTTVAGHLGTVRLGMSASRDGRTVFFSRVDSSSDELILVDNYR